ncbi:MAG TPA: acid-soluble spore protein [Clostridiales bacterium]|jgi:hypothetical protein|nr:acid-soluble spore protein [Clostridiales bacterium]
MSKIRKEYLYNLKVEAATELNRLQFIKENNDHDKSNVQSKINGQEGGPIGGRMVKKMIEEQMKQMMKP